jgi:hypothetical protein
MITENKNRLGNFTSSDIVRLTGVGKREMTSQELANRPKSGPGSSAKLIEDPGLLTDTAMEYILEKNMERRLERSLDTEGSARPLSWGKICEKQCFEVLPTSYKLSSDITFDHPTIPFWKGSPDSFCYDQSGTPIMVDDIKSPITMKSFCNLVDNFMEYGDGGRAIHAIRNGWTDKKGFARKPHPDGEKYYWQLVSNSCITGIDTAELIVYMPYLSELEKIREIIRNLDENQNPYGWINWSQDNELPHIPDGGYYKNITIIKFDVPFADQQLLKNKIILAGKHLIEA